MSEYAQIPSAKSCRTVLHFTVGSDSFHAEGPCSDVQGWLATWLALRTETPVHVRPFPIIRPLG